MVRDRLLTIPSSILRQVYSRLPISSGLTRLTFNPIVNRIFQGSPAHAMAELRDGTPIEVDLNDYHGRILYLFGSNDLKVAASAVALSRPGDVFLDIGANYSSIGFAVARVVGDNGAVHLFEPQHRIAEAVERAILAGHFLNVQLHRVGLLDTDGTFEIRGPKGHSGRATFAAHDDAREFELIEVCEVRAIQAYAPPLVTGRPFGAKVDIEGSEPKVMPWLLEQPNLRFLIFEAAHNHRELFDAVHDAGLVPYGLDRRPIGHRLTLLSDFAMMASFHDIVAIRGSSGRKLPARTSPTQLAAYLS